MAPKRKREPTTKATAPKPAKEAGGDISSTSAGQVVLPKGTKVSKRPILVPRRQKRKPAARRNATATKPDPPTKTQPTDVVPAVTTLPRHLKIQRIGPTAPAVSASHAQTRPRSPKPRGSSSLRTRRAPHMPPCLASHIAKLWTQHGLKELACPECAGPLQLRSVEHFCGPQIRAK